MSSRKTTKTYSELRKELDDALAWFESEEMEVDEVIDRYKKAVLLTKDLEEFLIESENSLKKL
jgi:exonuclease VII small subunit